MNRPRLIVIGPLPPPVHGVSVSTSLVLANEALRERFRVEHLDTSDHRPRNTIGRWEARNVQLALAHVRRISARLSDDGGVVYLPLSQGMAGFLRDAIFIRLAARRRWKVAAHLRGGEFHRFYEELNPLARGFVRSTLLRVDSVAVLGAGLRSLFAGLIPEKRIRVVPNGTPNPWPEGVPARGGSAVLFLSNLRRRKGLLEAVETARLVLARKPEARFVFAGEWDDAALARTVMDRARPYADAIRFLPPLRGDLKNQLLLDSSVLLFPPAAQEGHPRVVLEAIAAGLPVVTTRRGAIPDTVLDGRTGFVLPDPEPPALAARVLHLLEDPALRARMGRAARKHYLKRFTQERADRILAEWLAEVAELPALAAVRSR